MRCIHVFRKWSPQDLRSFTKPRFLKFHSLTTTSFRDHISCTRVLAGSICIVWILGIKARSLACWASTMLDGKSHIPALQHYLIVDSKENNGLTAPFTLSFCKNCCIFLSYCCFPVSGKGEKQLLKPRDVLSHHSTSASRLMGTSIIWLEKKDVGQMCF